MNTKTECPRALIGFVIRTTDILSVASLSNTSPSIEPRLAEISARSERTASVELDVTHIA